jgi:uncharacterized membrane protein YcaP (DUF421 family)
MINIKRQMENGTLRPFRDLLIFLVALLGKRELAQLNPFDLVVLLTPSNTVQNAIIGEDNSVTGDLIGAIALMTANYLLVRFIFKHRRLDQLLAGRPTTIIEGGRIRQGGLAKDLLTESELLKVLQGRRRRGAPLSLASVSGLCLWPLSLDGPF